MQALYDSAKIDALRANCKIYVHGHSAGGTNPSLVEAMFFGIPILAYDCCYNRETTQSRALYFADSAEIAGLLKDASEDDLLKAARDMKEIAENHYRWNQITGSYENLY